MTTISAREFNQQASQARQQASREPVFITERGQPRHVLLSIEEYQRLTGQRGTIAELLALPGDIDLDLPTARDLGRAAELD